MKKHTVVLITGGSCSGKSEFSKWFSDGLTVSLDSFYKPLNKIPKDAEGNYNFDVPESIDIKECAEAVKLLSEGKPAKIPLYNMKLNDRTGVETLRCTVSTKFIVVEGLFAFHSPLLELGDMKVFIDTPTETRIARRIIRDIERKGKSKIEIMKDFITAETHYQKYVEPTRKYADLIIPFSNNPLNIVERGT